VTACFDASDAAEVLPASRRVSRCPLRRPRAVENFSFDSLQENFMKHLVNLVSAVFVAALALTAVGCASTPQTEGTGEYVDDSVITGKVKAAILNEPSLKVAEINVETFKGVVQLSGFVSSQAAITKAVEVTRGVGGVKSVKNDMRIK
jgi:osmotically-inducible protein OsmY